MVRTLIGARVLLNGARLLIAAVLLGAVVPMMLATSSVARAEAGEWPKDSVSVRDTIRAGFDPMKEFWIVGGFGLQVGGPSLGDAGNVIGTYWKFGCVGRASGGMFVFRRVSHTPPDSPDQEEYWEALDMQYLYAIRETYYRIELSGGPSVVSYTEWVPGNMDSPPFVIGTKTVAGIGCAASIFFTPTRGLGLFGAGLYATLASAHSSIGLQVSIIDLSVRVK